MNADTFNAVLAHEINRITKVLGTKASEYADDADRLRNFKQAAHLKGETPRQALAGMMAKHTVSIYDLCMMPELADVAVWAEKITDHLNYLILLRALVQEEAHERIQRIVTEGL